MSDDILVKHAAAQALGLIAPPSTDKAHYEALGRFLSSFASAEGAVHLIARKLTGLSDEKARIIFAGFRLSDLLERIRGLIQLERKNKPKDETLTDIEECIEQLMHISTRRHNLVHRGVTFFAGTLISGNALIAKTLASIEMESISEEALIDMHLDCGVIFMRLSYIADSKTSDETWRRALRLRPWRYKPPPPNSKNPPHRGGAQLLKRQPRASRASRRREAMKKREKS
jgi:hypothetical protein